MWMNPMINFVYESNVINFPLTFHLFSSRELIKDKHVSYGSHSITDSNSHEG